MATTNGTTPSTSDPSPSPSQSPTSTETSASPTQSSSSLSNTSSASSPSTPTDTSQPVTSTDLTNTPTTSLPPNSSPQTSSPTTDTSTTASATTSESSKDTTSTSEPPTSTQKPTSIKTTSVVPSVIVSDGSTSTIYETKTSFIQPTSTQNSNSPESTTSGASNGAQPTGHSSGGLATSGKIAIAVVVPIVAVALLVLAGIWLWRRRKSRKDAEEQRRKEVEDYTYNPNADTSVPGVVGGAAGAAGGYEVKEDASSGYRGWGSTTLAGSTGRKASTTMSGGAAGAGFSDAASPARANVSDTRSADNMVSEGNHSPEGEILGAMGPAAATNRTGDVQRGPSNASSSYSGVARSDGSGENGVPYGDTNYYNQYGSSNPYTDQGGEGPVIRDNPARRNTRIENPSHYPQQSAGISQNF